MELKKDKWRKKKLSDVLKVRHGKSQHKVEVEYGKYPILGTGGQIGWAKTPLYTKPSVLIGRKGTINKPQYIDKPFWTIDTLFYTEIKEENNPKFIYYLFKTIDWLSLNEASGVPSLSAKNIENLKINIPTKVTQDKIAAALSDMDDLIESLEKIIDKKKKVKQGAMQQLLTGKKRLPGFTEEWEEVLLGEIMTLTTGKLDANAMVKGGKYRFYTCAKEYYYINNYAFDGEALLVSGNGAHVGYVHYYKGKFNAYQRTYVLMNFVKEIKYIKYYLDFYLKKWIEVEVNAGGTPFIKRTTLTEMPINIPKSTREQQAIASILIDMDAEIELLERKLSKYKKIKEGMMQQLLTGRVRLA